MAGTMKSANPKATVTEKSKGKQGGTNGTAKVQTGKSKPSGKVNTPPKGAVPMKMKMGGMKSKKSC